MFLRVEPGSEYQSDRPLLLPQSHNLVKVEVNTHKIDDSSPVDAQAAEIVRNAPQLKDAAMPGRKDSHSEIRLGSFKELSKVYNAKEGSQSS